MSARCHSRLTLRTFALMLALLAGILLAERKAAAEDKPDAKAAGPITKGLRVFTCGHSFHVWVLALVADLCRRAGSPDVAQIGVSSIGGSRVIQHRHAPDEKNLATAALRGSRA